MFSARLVGDGVAATSSVVIAAAEARITVVAIAEACVASFVDGVTAMSSVVAVVGRTVAEARVAVVAITEVRVVSLVDNVALTSSVVVVAGWPVTGGAR